MKTLGNLLWLVHTGLWMAIGYAFVGLLLCVTILLIPFGLQLFKLAGFCLWPFGRTVVRSPDAASASLLGNVLWFIPGVFIAAGHLMSAAALLLACVFIVTIPIALPFAIANLKLVPLALWPFGRAVVDQSQVTAAAFAVPAPR